jgi:hypothetical protein
VATLLEANRVVSFGLIVLIWLVQLVIYPAFASIAPERFARWHARYTRTVTWIVAPLMLGQAGLLGWLAEGLGGAFDLSEPVAAASVARGSTTAAAPFLPVSIVDPDAGTHLEIELANACVVRLRGPLNPPLLRAAIKAAGQLDGSRQGDH